MSSVSNLPHDTVSEGSKTDSFSALLEPLDELANHLTSIVAEIRNAESRYAAQLRDVVAGLRKTADEQARESISKEFDANFRSAVDMVREQFSAKLLDTRTELESERDALASQVQELKRYDRKDALLQAELKRTEQHLITAQAEIAKMVEAPDIELATIIRQNAMLVELKAYIRGLRFEVEFKDTSASDAAKKED